MINLCRARLYPKRLMLRSDASPGFEGQYGIWLRPSKHASDRWEVGRGLLITKRSFITAPFLKRIERRYASFVASPIPADRFPVVQKLQILSSSSSALGSTFYPFDPLSDIGRTILELDAIGLAAGEKFHRALVDECHVPQIQY